MTNFFEIAKLYCPEEGLGLGPGPDLQHAVQEGLWKASGKPLITLLSIECHEKVTIVTTSISITQFVLRKDHRSLALLVPHRDADHPWFRFWKTENTCLRLIAVIHIRRLPRSASRSKEPISPPAPLEETSSLRNGRF